MPMVTVPFCSKKCIPVLFFLSVLIFNACSKGSSAASYNSTLSVNNIIHIRDSLNTTLKFIITVEHPGAKAISVDYTTVDGTAKANIDYAPTSGTIKIAPNTTQKEVEVQIIGRKILSGIQQFYLTLSNPENATLAIEKGTATIQNPGFGYQMVWSDEFNGTGLNIDDWNYETGGNGWGNNELEYYTSGTSNAYLQGGNLVIEAKKENLGGKIYTSARLTTKGKRKFTYGKVEIRAKLPATSGIWPALWMLGDNIDQVSWPACGELDIMEAINKETPAKVYGTAHWGTSGANHLSSGGNYTLGAGYFSDNFHVFSIEWNADKIQWSVDGNTFYIVTSQQITGGNYPFDKDFFLILNVAVGGNWPGNPDGTSTFPQKMYVDYVRVFQK